MMVACAKVQYVDASLYLDKIRQDYTSALFRTEGYHYPGSWPIRFGLMYRISIN